MTDEVWKEINGYPSYMVSNKGRIKNCMRNKVLKPGLGKSGYLHVGLWRNNKPTYFDVQKLVAMAFIANPDNKPEVNHKDKVRTHNWSDNLEWCTRQENCEHSQAKAYKLLSPSGEIVEVFNLKRFSRENDLNYSSMSGIIHNRMKYHKGWRKYNG